MKQLLLCTLFATQFTSAMDVDLQQRAFEQEMVPFLQDLEKKAVDEGLEHCTSDLLPLLKNGIQKKLYNLANDYSCQEIAQALNEPSPEFKRLTEAYLRSVYLPEEDTAPSLYEFLTSEGSSSNVNILLSEGQTLLMCAVRKNDEPMVQLLLSLKANPNIGLTNGYSPLMFAIDNKRCPKGNTRIAKFLLEAGADANVKECFLGTALDLAISRENEELVELLLKYVDKNV